jgi:UDP-N-acetylmuramate--alanine ligase
MNQERHIYLLGIGGIGMSALARWYHQQGITVWGHDKAPSSLTDQLAAEGISIHFEESPAAIPAAIMQNLPHTPVVYSPAILPTHPIWAYLIKEECNPYKRAEIFDKITAQYTTWAVAGTHGKTTSTALLAHILYYAQQNITAFLGGIAKNYNTNLIHTQRDQKERTIVVEADEYDRFFLHLHPHGAIVTTIDPDHLEVYGDAAGFEEAFRQFLAKLPAQGLAIIHQEVARKLLAKPHNIVAPIERYALEDAPIQAQKVHLDEKGRFCFNYVSKNTTIEDIILSVPGYHHVENALAVITACLHQGILPLVIREAIQQFQGVERRFDVMLKHKDIVLIDDYGHHPVEITALLKTVRAVYPNKKVTVIFQPNQYSRTRDFLAEFGKSLSLADAVLVVDIYTDREIPIEGIGPAAIVAGISLAQKYVCSQENLIATLSQVKPLEVIVNVGAGNAGNFIEPLKAFLQAR